MMEKYVNSFRTVLQMLKDRGCKPKTTLSEQLTQEEWYNKFSKFVTNPKSNYNCKLVYIDTDGNKGGVFWPKSTKLGIDLVKYFTNLSINNQWSSFILIINNITPAAKKDLINNIKHVYNAEFFYIDNLQVNITRHKLQPKVFKLSEGEKEIVQQQFNVPLDKFPLMQEDDPVAQYYKFRKGDLIRTENYYDIYTNTNSLNVPIINYRYVISI